MRKFYFLLVSILFSVIVSAQVSVTATLGTAGPTSYTTVSDAFAAINAGTHQGDVTITITANTTEPSAPTALLKSAAPSSYTSVLIKPSGDVTINSAATPTTNRGIIELAGADNVTIDGDDPVTPGTRNLTVQVATSTNNTAAIRVSSNSATGTDGADNVTIKNCNIVGGRSTATTTATGSYGINVSQYSTSSLTTGAASCINLTVENNAITRAARGVYAQGASGYQLTGLKILNNILGSSTAALNIGNNGIFIAHTSPTAGSSSALIEGNDIRVGDVSISGTGYSASVSGIEIGTVNAGAIIRGNNIHDIYQPTTSGYGAYGITVSGSASCNDILIANNFLTNIATAKYTTTSLSTFTAYGIRYSAGATSQNIINNTIVLPAAVNGTLANYTNYGIAFGVSGVTVSKMYNNIVVNNNVGNGTFGVYVNTTTNISGGGVDNNNYYVPSGNVGYYNAALRASLADWQTATGKDGSSLNVNPTFVSATDFHLNYGTTATQLESGGASVATTGVSTDFDGQARPGPAGSVNGGASAPDLGADEFDGVPLDLTPPSISYSPLNFTCAAGNRTLSATITDASGVPTSGAGLPVLYWNINGGAYNAATGSHVSGSTYSFVFGAGAVLGDVVNYYIAAQDNAPTPNVGTFPIAGSAGYTTNPPAAATAPTTPSSYSISNTLNGIYTVGATGTYPTLTAALAAYNSSCLSGPVEFSLIDPLYSTSETFPLSINQNPDASATNTLTIRPAAGVTTSITGSVPSNGLIRILGSHVIIDGSNNGSGFQNLSIQNTNTTSPRVILAGSATAAPLVNVTLKNFYALNGSKTSTSALAIQISNSVGAAGNFNNILVENISVSTSYMGIYALANVATGNGSGLIIRNNGLDVSGPTSINYTGIYVQGTDGALVTGNRIGNFDGTTGQTDMGIWLATGTVNTVIEKNTIYNLVYTGTAGYNARGIYLSTGVTGSNNLIKNNMIYNMGGDGDDFATFGNQYNPTGIYLAGSTPQTGVEISNNTLFLSGNYINGTGTYVNGIALDDNSAASIRNNIIVNTSGTAGTGVGPVGIAAENSIAQFTALSNNAYNIATAGTGTNNIGKVGSTNYATLADFQAATSADANSKVTVPVFVSSTDLHLSTALGNNICLNGAATPLANVTDDFDGNPRDASTPDIGADEFAPTNPTFIVTDQSACFGGSVDLTAASVTAGSTAGQAFGYFTDAACTTAVTDPTMVGAGTYYIKATYTVDGCSIEQISPVVVSINALPTQYSVTGGGAYCAGGSGVEVGLSGSEVGVNYQLVLNGTTNVGSPVAGTGSAISFGNQTTVGSYTVTATNATTGCTAEMLVGGGWTVPSGLSGFNTSGTQTDLSFINQNVGWITDGTKVQKTTDGGVTWTTQFTASGATVLNCVYFLDANNGWAVGSGNVFLRTTDGGTNWTQSALPGFLSGVENYQSIYFTSATNGVMVGYNARYVSTDGGLTWTKTINSGIKSEVVMTSSTTGYLVGAAGAIQKTTDGGATWTAQTSGTFGALYDVNFLDDNTGYVVGASGFIAKTTDGGATWVAQTSGTTQTLNSVHFKDVNNGYAAGNGGVVLKTTDGGTTWAPETLSPTTTASFRAIYGSAAGTGVALAYGNIYTLASAVEVSTNPLPTPSITIAETSGLTNNDGTICAGASVSLTAAGGSSYSWSSGETTAAITVSPAATTTYTVTATDANGCQATASSTITVDALPTQYDVTGGGSYCSGGVGVSIGLNGSDVGISYELYESGTATGNIVTGTGSAISFGTITMAGTYTVVASDASTGCTANMIGSETVSVSDVPVINYVLAQPNNCNSNNGGADLTITGAAGPYSYNWTGLGIIPGVEDQTTLRVGSYTVVVTADNGCDATANFTLIGPGGCDVCPTIGAVATTPTAICQDGTATLSATGLADMGVSYGIDFVVSSSPLANPYTGTVVATVDNANLSGGGTSATASYTFTTSGTQYIYAILSPVPADPACRPFQAAQLTVVATPDVNAVSNQTVCSGAMTTAVNFTGSQANTVYTWTNSDPSIGLAASGTGDISSFTATNFTNAPVTSTVTVTPVNVAGLNQLINGTINGTSVLSERMLRDGVPSSCASPKAFPGVFSTGSFPYTTYTFTNSSGTTQCVSASVVATTNDVFLSAYTNTFNPSNISLNYLADAGFSSSSPTSTRGMTFNVPSGTSFVLVLHTTGAPTATFDLTVVNGVFVSCSGPSKTFDITVNPTPTVNTVAPVAACNGATVSVPFSGFVPGTVYEWTNSNTAIGLAASGTGDLSFTGTNAGTSPITANIIVTPKYTNDGQTCTGTPVAFTITINPTPTVNTVSNQVVCDNGATTAVSFSGAVTGTTYSWTNDTPSIGLAASGTGDIASFTAVNTTNAPVVATITVTPNYTNGGTTCSGTSTTFTITVNPQGQVNTVSNQTICNGANTTAVNFSTNNTGVTTTYSWTNSDPSIGLAASGTGDIPSFTGINTGTTPVTATVTVTPSYTIPGGSGGLTPVSIPSPVTYNVYDRQTTYTGVSVNGGSNSATVTPGSTVTLSYNYTVAFPGGGFCPGCIVQNYVGLGGTSQTLNCVNPVTNGSNGSRSLTFTAPTTPGVYYIQHGTTLEFSCIPLTYTNDPAGGGAYGAGAAIASIVVPDVTTCTGTPTTFTFTVNPTPTVNAVSSEVVCNNASTSAVTFSGEVTGTVYNWTNSNTAIGLAASGTGNIASFTATNSTNAPITATITVTPSYTNGGVTCTGTSTSYTITVNPTPTANTVSNQTLCNGAATTAVAFSGAVTGTVYNWTNNNTSIGLGASGSGDIASFTATNTTNAPVTATITVTPSFLNGGTLCTGTPTTFTITVNPTANVVATPAAQTICSANAITSIVLTGNVTGTTYSWTRDNTTAVTGIAASGTGDITGTLTNTTYAPVTVTFTITPSANGCTGTPITATVLVNPTPVLTPDPAYPSWVCSGTSFDIEPVYIVNGTTITWTRDNIVSVTGIPASGTGDPVGTAVNTTNAPVTVTFTIIPTANGCTGAPYMPTLTVNPIPTVNAVSNQVVCNRSNTTAVAFSGAVTGTVYSWTNNTPSIGLAASGTGNIAAFTAVNTTQAPIVATITVTPSFTNGGTLCTGTPRTFTITVNPTPIVVATDLFNQRICISDAPVALNATPVGGTWSGIGVSGFNFVPSAAAVGNFILTYTYTNQFGCTSTDTTTAKVLACDERNRSLEAGGAILYPNPNGGQFNIRVNSMRFQFLQMRIYNALGQLISTKQWNGLTFGQILPVDMRHLPAAVYTVRIIYDGGNLYEDRGYQMLIQH